MVYRKNIYRWEQIVRIIAGLAVAIYGAAVMPDDAVGYMMIAVGGFMALTGVFGFCSACAMIGRRLK